MLDSLEIGGGDPKLQYSIYPTRQWREDGHSASMRTAVHYSNRRSLAGASLAAETGAT